MFKKEKILKNKKIIYLIIWFILLVLYYSFFFQWKKDFNFNAKDLEVKIIDNKTDFEDIIVKNIYNKIEESCTENTQIFKKDTRRIFVDNSRRENIRRWGISFWASKVSDNMKWSADTWLSIPSIDFDWQEAKEIITEKVNFSQTNIQKQEVDEGDILKQTKDYIFYFSKKTSKIYIIKSPLDTDKIDIGNTKIIFTIDIPSNLTLKPELFVNDNRLVYLASKESYNNHNTIVWIYDISHLENKEVKLFKIFETKWEYFKSRLIDNKLYLISNYSLSPFKNEFCNIIKNEWKSDIRSFIKFFTWIKLNWFWINQELFQELKEELESYSYKLNSNNLAGDTKKEKLSDFKIFYTNKDLKEPIENLNFNIVSTIDIENKELKDTQALVFWNLEDWEIHMTLNNLYLVNSYFRPEKWKCDYIDICYKEFSSNNFTSISKISYDATDLNYEKTSIIPWRPINQYSMDEDEGYFRIFTANDSLRNRNVSLYIFNDKLRLIWNLDNIKPNEEFKSSRFIWDKVFLVTFRQRDPLFVIDLHIPSKPEIIWELHIPGFSSYLHPYWKIWNKDYLIWIWRERENVKVDLYEVNYDKKTLWNQIEVKQKYKYIFKGWISSTPAETNPRTFVWDNLEKILYLPIVIRWNRHLHIVDCLKWEKWCIEQIDSNWNKIYTKTVFENKDFFWIKALSIKLNNWIQEIESKEVRETDIINSRVWYYKNELNQSLFFVWEDFISFFWKDSKANTIDFN